MLFDPLSIMLVLDLKHTPIIVIGKYFDLQSWLCNTFIIRIDWNGSEKNGGWLCHEHGRGFT